MKQIKYLFIIYIICASFASCTFPEDKEPAKPTYTFLSNGFQIQNLESPYLNAITYFVRINFFDDDNSFSIIQYTDNLKENTAVSLAKGIYIPESDGSLENEILSFRVKYSINESGKLEKLTVEKTIGPFSIVNGQFTINQTQDKESFFPLNQDLTFKKE